MNSKVTYLMEGFNIQEPGYCRKMLLKNNKEYIYKNHSFLKSVKHWGLTIKNNRKDNNLHIKEL